MKRFRKHYLVLLAVMVIFSNLTYSFAVSEVPEENIVEDIEISNYREEIVIGESVELNASVVPIDSIETINYMSSDESVATISSTGEIEGVSKGRTTITVSAGELAKELELKVRVPAKDIEVKQEYIVMAEGETFDLQASVIPEDAEISTTFRSTDEAIAEVSANGIIDAKKTGSTSIIVENEDVTKVISVMVNEGSSSDESYVYDKERESSNNEDGIQTAKEGEIIVLKGAETKKIDDSLLKRIIGTEAKCKIQYKEYSLTIKGSDIVNARNELKTDLKFEQTEQGLSFQVNEGAPLPGKIYITLDTGGKYKYFYIYHDIKERYQKLDFSLVEGTFSIDTPGKYILTTEKINDSKIPLVWLLASAGIILVGIVVYICIKNKHWFW